MRGELIGFGDKDLLYGKKRREVSRTISTFWIKQLRIGITVRHEKWTSFFFFFPFGGTTYRDHAFSFGFVEFEPILRHLHSETELTVCRLF